MSKTLVILESPSKIKTLQKILGSNYVFKASFGHIIDLDPKSMSIDIKDGIFTPKYKTISGKEKVIKEIKEEYKKCKDILLMPDGDREGFAISYFVAQTLNIKNPQRIDFHSITKTEILEAIKKPIPLDENVVNAQKGRRMLDRIVGYELSPLLDKHLKQHSLSAGRVQSVVARLIVDRENEIKEFMKKDIKSYFKVNGEFTFDKSNKLSAQLYDLTGKTKDKAFKGTISKISTEELTRKFLEDCFTSEFKINNVFTKPRIQSPSPPFTTSTLQQEANRKFGFSIKQTMQIAQKLYEAGHITYMRTDSVTLSVDAHKNIKQHIVETYGENYYRRVDYKSKNQNTQEAHEAIRPTDISKDTINTKPEENKLYNLIWKRTVASQMQPAKFDVTSIQISISSTKDYYFQSQTEVMTFEGYLTVYNIQNTKDDKEDQDKEETTSLVNKVPEVDTILEPIKIVASQDYEKPPGRYNEASLVDKLDPKNLNIGRPATYATIVTKIQDKNYVKKDNINGVEKEAKSLCWISNKNKKKQTIEENSKKIVLGKETNKFVPTTLGITVTNFLLKNFPDIMDYKFTAEMEEKLDQIADGTADLNKILDEFYKKFHPLVVNILDKIPVIDDEHTKLLGEEPETKNKIYVTLAKYGPVVKMVQPDNKFKFAPIKEPLTMETITLEQALKLFEYPKELGKHGRSKVVLNKGKYGLYLTVGKNKYSVNEEYDDNITLEEAIEIINSKKKTSLGEFSDNSKTYTVLDGPYGKYIRVVNTKTKKQFNVSVPQNEDISKLTTKRINEIITAKFNNTNNNNNKKQTFKSKSKTQGKAKPKK